MIFGKMNLKTLTFDTLLFINRFYFWNILF